MKSKQKIAKAVGFLLIISSIISMGFIAFTSVFANKNVDTDYDEMLFSLSKCGSYTEYYVDKNKSAVSLSTYDPELICSLSLGEAKKSYIHISEKFIC